MLSCTKIECTREASTKEDQPMEKPLSTLEKKFSDERVAGLISDKSDYVEIPRDYIRPPSERPRLNEVALSDSISVFDLSELNGPSRQSVIQKIGHACQEDGFFQIVNHGVPETVINTMLEVAKEFFNMPVEYRQQFYSEDPSCVVRLSTSFNVRKENVYNWRDYLRHHCYPLNKYVDAWPSEPPAYREVVSKYCTEIRALVLRLLAAISESLGLEQDFLDRALGKHAQQMAINYYPRCPNPELTYGLPSHSDPNALTILLQDNVSGLQVLKSGIWSAVEPIPNAFVVNVGDQLQVLSNGIYKSGIHRAVVNSSLARISLPTFYCPSPDAVIEPASPLISKDNPARYKKYTYEKYYQKFWSNSLQEKTCLNSVTYDEACNNE